MSNPKRRVNRFKLSQCIHGCESIMDRSFLKRKKKREIDIQVMIDARDIVFGVAEVELTEIAVPSYISIYIRISSMIIINFRA